MRVTKPCAGDDPFRIEGSVEQHELLLSDMSLAPPDSAGKCRRLYNRQGEQTAAAPSPHVVTVSPYMPSELSFSYDQAHQTVQLRLSSSLLLYMQLIWCLIMAAEEHQDNLSGDINMVNGVPWPVMTIQAKYHRFRVSSSVLSCSCHQSTWSTQMCFPETQ
jgi:hypothetical protein